MHGAVVYLYMMNKIKILLILAVCSASMACSQTRDESFKTVDPVEFADEIKSDTSAYILDVRTPQEYTDGHIAGAHNLDWLNQAAFKQGATSLPKDQTIYVYCRSGRRSAEAAGYLTSLGYKVVDLEGGYLAWQKMHRR